MFSLTISKPGFALLLASFIFTPLACHAWSGFGQQCAAQNISVWQADWNVPRPPWILEAHCDDKDHNIKDNYINLDGCITFDYDSMFPQFGGRVIQTICVRNLLTSQSRPRISGEGRCDSCKLNDGDYSVLDLTCRCLGSTGWEDYSTSLSASALQIKLPADQFQ